MLYDHVKNPGENINVAEDSLFPFGIARACKTTHAHP